MNANQHSGGGTTFSFLPLTFSILFVSTFMSSILEGTWPWIGFSDEALAIFVFTASVLRFQILAREWRSILILLLFVFYVLSISYFSPYYQGLVLVLTDVFLFLKPLLVFYALMAWPYRYINQIKKLILPLCFVYLILAFSSYFINLVVPIFPPGQIRFGIDSYEFIAANEGEFANLVMIAGVLLYSLSTRAKMRGFALVAMSFLALASLRFKAIVLTTSFLMFVGLRKTRMFDRREFKIRKPAGIRLSRIRTGYLMVLLPVALATGVGQFVDYFLSGLTPRSFIFQNSIAIAGEFFPFGAGAGTYGSAVAKLQYSELYNTLGFYSRWGLSETDGRFLNDNFWPMVVAQYGVIGMAIIIPLYARIVSVAYRRWSLDSRKSIAAMMIVLNLALSTIGSAILIGGLGILLISTLVIIIRIDDEEVNRLRHA